MTARHRAAVQNLFPKKKNVVEAYACSVETRFCSVLWGIVEICACSAAKLFTTQATSEHTCPPPPSLSGRRPQVMEDLQSRFSTGLFGANVVAQLEVHLHLLSLYTIEVRQKKGGKEGLLSIIFIFISRLREERCCDLLLLLLLFSFRGLHSECPAFLSRLSGLAVAYFV